MQPRIRFFQRLQNRLPELGGFALFGLGVILLLSSLFYMPFYLQANPQVQRVSSVNAMLFLGNGAGILMLIVAFGALTAGYIVVSKYVPGQPNTLIWLTVFEVLAESSILGWLLMVSGIVLPIPSSTWSILWATWLAGFLGGLGALILPVSVLCTCFYLKRNLRKFGSWSNLFEAHKG